MSRLLRVGILIILAVLFIRTIRLDLPYRYHVDEDYFYTSAMNIRSTGTQFNVLYPPLSPYLTSAISVVMDAASGATQYAGDARYSAPTYFAGRLSSAFFMLVACCFLYLIGKRLHSPAAGLAAMALFGVDAEVFAFSYQMKGDPAAYCFMTASIYFALISFENPQQQRTRWFSTIAMLIAILAKYSVAPLAVFPAYLWLRKLVPSVRRQVLIISVFGLSALGAVVAIRIFGQSWKPIFENAGFLFLFEPNPLNMAFLVSSLSNIKTFMYPIAFSFALVITVLVALTFWRTLNATQRFAYLAMGLVALSFVPLGSMLALRYRDIFVFPFCLFILFPVSLGILADRYIGRVSWLVPAIAALLLVIPAFITDWQQSDDLRRGDDRVTASHWLESHVRVPSAIINEVMGDFLPHVSGYQGGYNSWITVHSILDKTPEKWWEDGVLYAIADQRAKADTWFDPTTDKALYNGFTLAYESPPNTPGPKLAIFYTFKIKSQIERRLGDLAEMFGYNVDKREVCPGTQLPMRIFLRAQRRTNIFYETEVTLRDSATGIAVLTHRQVPAVGQRPTTAWEPYELIFDDHWLSIPPDLKPGTYTLEYAIYEPYHSQHLSVIDNNDQMIGESISIGSVNISNNYCPSYF